MMRFQVFLFFGVLQAVCATKVSKLVIDRYLFFITDTNYLHVYVPYNRYAEYLFTVIK